jgi:spermidine/putrescine transport system substrate-binding protein
MTGSWNDLWDHQAASGHIYLLDQIEEALGASLLRLGYPIDSANPDQVNKAASALIELKPRLAGFSTADYTNLENGSGWIQHAWSGDVYIALGKVKDTSKIRFETCHDGTPIGVDTMSIPAKAQHPGTALLFIDWVLRPDNSRACVEWMGQANGTTAGNAAFNQLVADFPFLQTSDEILARGAWKRVPTGGQQQLWAQAWSRVKAS